MPLPTEALEIKISTVSVKIFETVDDGRWTQDHGHPIISPTPMSPISVLLLVRYFRLTNKIIIFSDMIFSSMNYKFSHHELHSEHERAVVF